VFKSGEIWTFGVVKEDRESNASHEHVTLRFNASGTIERYAQEAKDGAKMTRKWHEVGMWCGTYYAFHVECRMHDVAGTHMNRPGIAVHGYRAVSVRTMARKCYYRGKYLVSNIDTLSGCGRNKDAEADTKRKALKGIDMATAMKARRNASETKTDTAIRINPETLTILL